MSESLVEYLATQDNLVQEAAEALPHQFSSCTYSLRHIRQAVYLCQTCPESKGICSACSIACHTDHEQIELFPKRNFRCDCPTEGLAHSCSLHKTLEPGNSINIYGQNFQGLFCRCNRTYDANVERETMIQCLVCEDWFHESCCNLRERPSSRPPTPNQEHQEQEEIDDAQSDTSSSGLPPPLLGASDYDTLVCSACVSKMPLLQRYAGTLGALIVARENAEGSWRVFPPSQSEEAVTVEVADVATLSSSGSQKRAASPSSTEPDSKRQRLSPSTPQCLAPVPHPFVERMYTSLKEKNPVLGTGDIFFTEGFRDRFCRCSSCLTSLEPVRCLLEEEETYEPPPDPDSGLSLDELGMRALSRLPRDRAIDGIHAFNAMREDLVQFLRPFAQDGKVVAEKDVKTFFR